MSPEKLEIELERLRAMKEYEYSFLSKENVVIAGVDEAGRGPLAGPVVAAAAILNVDDDFIYLNDSKKVTPKRRDILYNDIMNRTIYGIGIVSAEEIDEMNILQATYEAMRQAIWEKPACHNFSDERRDEEVGQKKEHRAMYGIGG